MTSQETIDQRNAAFWDELCGSIMAQTIGITDHSPESLRRFDAAYMEFYPYLARQLRSPTTAGERLLEIGLGFGTVSQRLAEMGFDYHGLDIAAGPVEIVRERLRRLEVDDAEQRVVQGSALEIPHPDGAFGHLVTIGCLHHTGDLPRALGEVHRALRPGGTAMVMLYNRHSWRQLVLHARSVRDAEKRGAYDTNVAGEAAPETAYVTARQVHDELFARFADVRIERHNFDPVVLTGFRGLSLTIPRERLLPNVARVLGLDLYIHARK
jgi:SAM-dependent methyltransferase